MLPDYRDITDIAGAPLWWDQNGVPRYAPFDPDMLGVYDRFALLVTIECQACRERMQVGCGWTAWETKLCTGESDGRTWDVVTHSLRSLAESFGYGDPPRHGCDGAGETMTSDLVRIDEAWDRTSREWARDSEIEAIDLHSNAARVLREATEERR